MASFLALILVLAVSSSAQAGVEQLSEKEFRALAAELAPKVNLFKAVWAQDPQAEFYGGTSRDYLYWLKGQFREAQTPAEAKRIAVALRAQEIFDVSEFIVGDSDIDLVSGKALALQAEDFHVRKIDFQSADIFNPGSEAGFNELNQGYAPAEKIRLSQNGLIPNPGLGEGATEIYRGKLTVHFADPKTFATTKFAREGINHPSLLALRYLRLQALNYFRTYGSGYPNEAQLLEGIDKKSAEGVRQILQRTVASGELEKFLAQPRFATWINGTIQKAFRSYTNPTAAHLLMKEFGVDALVSRYADKIEPINQFVFAKHRDEAQIRKNFLAAKVNPADLLADPAKEFPDGFLYHGTRTERAFRDIQFEGILPSVKGAAGDGLYGVAAPFRAHAEWIAGSKDRLLRFSVKPQARIVDITRGLGKALMRKWRDQDDFDGFANAYGIDILKYPYGTTEAYVVMNSEVIGEAEGVYRQLMPLNKLMERAKAISDMNELLPLLQANALSDEEMQLVAKASVVNRASIRAALVSLNPYAPAQRIAPATPAAKFATFKTFLRHFFAAEAKPADQKIVSALMADGTLVKDTLADELFTHPAWLKQKEFVLSELDKATGTNKLLFIRALSRSGFWDQHPQALRERFLAAPWLAGVNDASQWGEGVKDWNQHEKFFFELLDRYQKNAGVNPVVDEIVRQQINSGMLQASFVEEKPALFFDWNSHLHELGDPKPLSDWRKKCGYFIQADRSPWANSQALAKLLGIERTHPSSIFQAWNGEKTLANLYEAWSEEKRRAKAQDFLAKPGTDCGVKFGGLR